MSDDTTLDLTDVLAIDDAVTRSTGSAHFGVTANGFLPKPFTRLLAEKIALARQLIDPDLDLSSGSLVRKLLEVSALEDARTWAALAATYDDCFAGTARGRALSELGTELGIPRPYLTATGTVVLSLSGALPQGVTELVLPRGSRLTTPGGHRVALAASATLSAALTSVTVAVTSFDPGPIGDLDPNTTDAAGGHPQRVDRWETADENLTAMLDADLAAGLPPGASATGAGLVRIQHTVPLTGGADQWDDERYRTLLLAAPRSVWTTESIAATVALIPGVRQVAVRDGWGGLDLSQSIFGDFDFIERLFATDRDLASPFFVTVLVAPTDAAIWAGPHGLKAEVEQAIADVRPIGVFPNVVRADQVFVAVEADVLTSGLPLPSGDVASRNSSPAAQALKARLTARLHAVLDNLTLSQPVRSAAIVAALMAEPGVIDVGAVRLVRFPPALDGIGSGQPLPGTPGDIGVDQNLSLTADQIAVLVEAPDLLTVR